MAIEKIHISRFLELVRAFPILDVRSPGEFNHAHVPGAYSLPLFTDEERKIVGTAYKQQGRQPAIKLGLDFFGPRMHSMVDEVEKILSAWQTAPEQLTHKPGTTNTVIVHCWRGGMRSAGVAWLLDLYGFKVYTLAGGYKTFRNWALSQFKIPYRFNILGGYTGSGKTESLKELERMEEIVIDLEDLAGHKGSAFGNIGLPVQPTQEMFENKLALHLHASAAQSDARQKAIWLEDESQRIGTVNLPQQLWLTMRSSPVCFIDIPFEERLRHIVAEYGNLDRERLHDAICRLQKRLGGLETKTARAYLEEGNMQECFRILLKYYDKYYQKGLRSRPDLATLLTTIPCETVDAPRNARAACRHTQSIKV